MRMAEQQQAHRHDIERTVVNGELSVAKLGGWLGLVVSLCAVGGSVFTALAGAHWSVSVALVGVPLAGVVRAFLARGVRKL